MKEKGKLVNEGMGGFLNPPTHPEHSWSVEYDLRRKRENRGHCSLSWATKLDWLDDAIKQQAEAKLASWQRPPIDSPEIKQWILQVLGYFRNCYRNSQVDWAAGSLLFKAQYEMTHADDHAGVHFIRQFYPEYQPTDDDFVNARWG